MKVALKKGLNVFFRDIVLPSLQNDQIRIKVDACGICGTDIHVNPAEEEAESPFGHEIAGVILELGSGVVGLEVGQKIVVESATPCGKCEKCRNAQQELCLDIQSFFFTGYFGFAEEAIVPAICAIPCEDITPEVACLSEPLGVAIDMVRLADINTNSNVLIMGQGPIGLMATALVKKAGARRVFVSEFARRIVRKEFAGKLGIDGFIDPSQTNLREFDFGCEIDRVLMTAPPKCLNDAFEIAAKGAIISFIGIAHGDGAFCDININEFHFKKLQLRASFASPALYTPMALKYLREGVIDGESMISHRFGLAELQKAVDIASDASALKIMITP